MRDIAKYTEDYSQHDFEDYQMMYRRKKVLEFISKYKASQILEIGCGMEPLFSFLEGMYSFYTVIEPSDVFYDNAVQLKGDCPKIECLHGFFGEDRMMRVLSNRHYDFIICSSLLHEVENNETFVKYMHDICNDGTVVTIHVPNANSFHRLLAKQMKIVSDEHEKTERNVMLQQQVVFDLNSLSNLVTAQGFKIIDSGSYFIKPFTHKQMYQMMEDKIITIETLDGLYRLGTLFPEIGSEIYVNCQIR